MIHQKNSLIGDYLCDWRIWSPNSITLHVKVHDTPYPCYTANELAERLTNKLAERLTNELAEKLTNELQKLTSFQIVSESMKR